MSEPEMDLDLWRALTVTQPWGGLLAAGIKPIENRSRKIAPRGLFGKRFAIHASREIDLDVYARICDIAPELFDDDEEIPEDGDDPWASVTRSIVAKYPTPIDAPWVPLSRVTSAIIAVATLAHEVLIGQGEERNKLWRGDLTYVEEKLGPGAARWFFGPYGYVLTNVTILPDPVPCRGFQGFWTMTAPTREAVVAQLARAEAA